jgi:hypothetical protein
MVQDNQDLTLQVRRVYLYLPQSASLCTLPRWDLDWVLANICIVDKANL